ncbi:hypothetical protein V502_00490 [Pseudogymnoascus sp. VKM F-4520 (FW-2644)]|nr:hypothetical protein V502_00490 [Pseudogymnoascus sp. VKM F-4520 (FW-2644)]
MATADTLNNLVRYCIKYHTKIKIKPNPVSSDRPQASTIVASPSTFSPIAGINYTLGVSSPSRDDGFGDVFISVSFRPRYQWVAIGIGSQMRGSTIFVIYTDGRGNVTVSPRDGQGHHQPLFNSSSTVTVLDGSGANAQLVKANFRYAAPAGKINLLNQKAAFIGSWKEGVAFSTMDKQVVLSYHDGQSKFVLNVEGADVGNSSNPFVRGTALESTLTDADMLDKTTIQQYPYNLRAERGGLFAFAHKWYGRILITMAIVNGELGLRLAGNSTGKMIAYAATGGVVMILYFVVIGYTVLNKKKDEEAGELELI